MPAKKHHIKLGADERDELEALCRKQNAAAFKVARAKALLATDCGPLGPGASDAEASALSGLSIPTLERLRRRACDVGPLGALLRKPRETPPVPAKVTGAIEAHMVRIACSEPPQGRDCWTMQMVADRLVELELVETISGETVRTTLKKTTLSHGNRSAGVSRRKATPPS
jgi:hypothetical protein